MYPAILFGVLFTNGLCANLQYGDSTDRIGYSLNYPSTASSLYNSDLYKTSRLSNEVSPYSSQYNNYNSGYSTSRYNSNGGYSTPSYGTYSPGYSSSTDSLYNSVYTTSRYGEGYGTGYGTSPSYGLGQSYGSTGSGYGAGLAGQSYGAGQTYGTGQSYGTYGAGSYSTGSTYRAGQGYGTGYGAGQSYGGAGQNYGTGQSYGTGYGAGQSYGAGYGTGQSYGAAGSYGSGGSNGAGQTMGSGQGRGSGQGFGSYGSYGGYNSRQGEYTSYERPLMSGMGQYCVNRSPQVGIWVDSLMGMWYGVEHIQHSGGFANSYYDYARTCIVMHLSEPIEQPTTDNVVYHVQHLKAKLRQEYRHLRLLWDEEGQTIEYALYFRNDSAGYWQVFDRQNGSLTTSSNYQQFSGTIQVLKAVNDHIVLNFCQEPGNGRPAQLYSVLFSREPGQMLPWELDSVHNMLQSKQLSVGSRRMVCGNSSATKVFTSFVMTLFVGALAALLGKS